MDLKLKAVTLTGLDTCHCALPGPWQASKHIVFGGIDRINADAHTHDADIHQLPREPIVDQHAIGAKHHHEPKAHSFAGDMENIGSRERLPAGHDYDRVAVDLSHLLEQRIDFQGGQFIGTTTGAGRGVEITVRAAQVAALRQVQAIR